MTEPDDEPELRWSRLNPERWLGLPPVPRHLAKP